MKQAHILALLLCILVLGNLAAPVGMQEAVAAARSDCNALVLDSAGILSGSSVLSAAQRLQRLAGDVRVLTIQTFAPFGTIDQYEADRLSRCPSWQATDGGMKNDLVVVMMSLAEHKTGIYYGSQWSGALDSAYLTIQTDSMNPRFRDGDFVGGVAAGLNALQQTINNQLHPPPVPPQQATDYSWIGKTILAIVVAAFIWWLIRARVRALTLGRAAKARRRATQQEAEQLRTQLQTMVLNLDPSVTTLRSALDAIEAHVDPRTIADLRASVQQLQSQVTGVILAYGTIEHQNPSQPALSELEYRQMATATRALLDEATAALRLVETLNQQLDELRELIKRAPELLTGAQQKITSATSDVAAVAAIGLLVSSVEPLLNEAHSLVVQAIAAQGAGRSADAGRLAKQAGEVAERAMVDAAALQDTPRALAQEILGLQAAADEFTQDSLPRLSNMMEELAFYARASLQSVEGHADASQVCLEHIRAALSDAERAGSLTAQDWERARTRIGDAKQFLQTARGLIQNTADLLKTLRFAKTTLPGAIAPALRHVEDVRAYIEQYPYGISITSLDTALGNATQRILQLQVDLTEPQPDYLGIDSALKETRATVVDILTSAKQQHADAVGPEESAREQTASRASETIGRSVAAGRYSPTIYVPVTTPTWSLPNSGGGSTDWGSSNSGGGSTSW